MRPAAALALLVFAVPATLRAQAVVDPGMSKAQVIAKLGKPNVEKQSGKFAYLYYSNGAEKAVGMSDVVLLEDDKVVDAVFRSTARKYSGKSSSPSAISAEVARKRPQATAPSPAPMTVPAAPAPAAAPAAAAPAPAGGAMPGAKAPSRMPAQEANAAKAVEPTPQARSAILEQQKAAAKAADSAKKADSAKAAKKP
jgi:hypothetical protein